MCNAEFNVVWAQSLYSLNNLIVGDFKLHCQDITWLGPKQCRTKSSTLLVVECIYWSSNNTGVCKLLNNDSEVEQQMNNEVKRSSLLSASVQIPQISQNDALGQQSLLIAQSRK